LKKIIFFTSQAFSLINFRGPLIRDLIAAKHVVYAVAPDFNEDLRTQVITLGAIPVDLSLSRTGMNPFKDFIDLVRLTVLLRKLNPDVILSYFVKPVIYGTLAGWIAGVPRRVAMIEGLGFTFGHSIDSASFKRNFLRVIVARLYRFALAKADKVVVLNHEDLEELVDSGLVGADKVVNIGGIGVDLNEWQFHPPVLEPVCFLLAARLLREKGILEYAEAARAVKSVHPEVRFILLGGIDPNPGGLKVDDINPLVNEGLLEWPGHVPVKPWLKQASVYVLPSYYREGVPRSSQEAMAMGRPIITTNAPGCRETVVEGLNGFLVPLRNSDAIAHAMLRFIEQPDLIAKMGGASRTLAEKKFDVIKINAELMRYLLNIDRSGDGVN
jgi:glycosyltransferase involved in cell wall biosynthesis